MVARGGPIREANQDSEAARRVRIDIQSIRINGTTDTRIFSEQISRPYMTQDNPRARNASDS
jgi:hypothetical protein